MNKNQIEVRSMRLDGVKENADGSLLVSGYVNETGSWSQTLGTNTKFIEKIESGAFQRALSKNSNVDFLYNHDKNQVLADMESNTLTLKEDQRGLYMEAKIVPTSYGKDAFELIKNGVVKHMSFGFRALKDKVTKGTNGIYERVVHELELLEVSAVRKPAYIQSSIHARSMEIVEDIEIKGDLNTMTKDELKTERIAIIKEGMELEAQARKENRSLNEFEKANKQDLLELKKQLESKIEEFGNDEQRNIIVISEDKTEEITAEHRAMEAVIKGETTEEVRALTTDKQTGAYLVPTSISDQIIKQVHHAAKLFSRTKQYPAVIGKLEILREDTIGSAGFVGEWEDEIKPTDFSMNKIALGQKRVGSAIELSDKVVKDTGLNPLKYSFGVLGRRLSKVIDKEILFGNNSATGLEGILTLDANGIDKITTITSASKNTMTADELYDVVLNVKSEYSREGIWLMHSSTFSHLLKMKDEAGAPLILPDKITGAPIQKLFGNPIVFDDNMDKVEAGKTPILFANFGKGYATTVKKDLHLEHIWQDEESRARRRHLLILDTYLDGKILNKECFAKLKMQA